MDRVTKKLAAHQINVYLTKYPGASVKETVRFIQSGSQGDCNLEDVKRNTLNQFVTYNIAKFHSTGSCIQRVPGSGRPKDVTGDRSNIRKVLSAFENKVTPGQNNVATKIDVSQSSVHRILKEHDIKPYHKVREQSLTERHMADRVTFGRWLLEKFGHDGSKGQWLFVVNTDFSAYVRTEPRHNSKNDVVYAKDKENIRQLLSNKEKKFAPGVMLWGGISSRGLVPPSAPLFIDEVLSAWTKDDKPVKHVNGTIYADMLETLVLPGILELYPQNNAIFQDDEAVIHRTKEVLATADRIFKKRIPPKMASCTADLLPIENIWSLIKSDVAKNQPIKDLPHLKRVITKKWRSLNNDKDLLKRMMASLPNRLEAMIRLKGQQVHKEDYE